MQLSFWKTPLMMAFDKTNLKNLVKNKTISELDLVGGHVHACYTI